ncbi:T9SS type A sorting domain-containing protein [Flavobacterium sp.]|uniref:T9SS type A sorting domain-containing protein n=1 Tax=Flavobacterium sp. TaxID=239 RepID=UPI00286ABBE3|nr:T9SS type A sorting domain-containing protein [Flavobacterium sp.]
MKKFLLSFLLLLICQFAVGQTLNFVNKADMPTARAGFSAASYGADEYIVNGFSNTQAYTSQIEKYDFLNNSWSTFATSPATIAKRYGNAAILSNILYLYNGITATGLNDKLEVIELSTGNVSVLPNLNPNPVYSAGSALYGDYLLSFGGCVNEWTGNYSNKLYKIAPWGEWTQLAYMPIALETKGTVVYENGNAKIYAFGGYSQTDGLHENFETVATTGNLALTNWVNVTETGTKAFQGKFFGPNKYAQISAFGATAPEQEASNIAWLISPVIPFGVTSDTYLNFDTKDGFSNGASLQAYIITNWTGDITTSTKTLLNATISSGHTTGYAPDFVNSGLISLAGNPGNFRIAFKYSGGYADSATTTFQIDNVKVYYEYKSRNVYIYDFNANTWTTQWDVLPQEISAHDVTIADPFSSPAKIYVSGDYQNQTFLGEYNTEDHTFTSINQTNMIGRRHHSSGIFDNKLFIFGGNTTSQILSSLNSTQSADLSTLATTTFNNQNIVSFYPNPATDKISLNPNIESALLYTFEGKKIDVAVQNNEINISGLANGIYLIQGINKDGSQFSDKLIKN